MNDSLKVGLIGCGGIAKAHLKAYRENSTIPLAFTDKRIEAARALASENGSGTVFSTYNEMIESGEVNVVSICTPPSFHEEAAVMALRHNIHVLCEKPLAHTVESGRNIIKAQKSSKALLMTGFTHRFRPAILELKKLISDGAVGPIVLFNNAFCGPAESMKDTWFAKKNIAGGGSMLDTSIHSIDLFRFLVGEIVEQSACNSRNLEGTDVEDTAIIVVKSNSGSIGSIISSWVASAWIAYIDIVGRKGRLLYSYGDNIRNYLQSGEEKVIPVPTEHGFRGEIAHFLSAIRGETELSCTGEEGLRALEVVFSCYK